MYVENRRRLIQGNQKAEVPNCVPNDTNLKWALNPINQPNWPCCCLIVVLRDSVISVWIANAMLGWVVWERHWAAVSV